MDSPSSRDSRTPGASLVRYNKMHMSQMDSSLSAVTVKWLGAVYFNFYYTLPSRALGAGRVYPSMNSDG